MKNKVSVITVCYNTSESIENTILSVLEQNYNNFEYIIVDGHSTDGTVGIINSYKSEFNKRRINLKVLIESDKGIYDAMNKGISLADGDWVNFMNAGDFFYSQNVLSSVFKNNIDIDDKVLIYGYKYQNNEIIYPQDVSVLKDGSIMGNHQSMFFNKEKLGSNCKYDLRYSIYGDYELVNRLFLKYGEKMFLYLNLPIAIYEGGGISEKPSFKKRKDKMLITYRNYGFFAVVKYIIKKLKN